MKLTYSCSTPRMTLRHSRTFLSSEKWTFDDCAIRASDTSSLFRVSITPCTLPRVEIARWIS